MANLTISIPDELKQQMDGAQFQDTNWSSVCRSALQQYVITRQSVQPYLDMFLDSVLQEVSSDLGVPGIRTNIRIENRMSMELLVDRINLVASIISGSVVILGQEMWHLAPLYLYPNRNSAFVDFFPLNPVQLVATGSSVKVSPLVRVKATAYVMGFQMPMQVQLTSKIPLDEWQTYITNLSAIYASKAALGKS